MLSERTERICFEGKELRTGIDQKYRKQEKDGKYCIIIIIIIKFIPIPALELYKMIDNVR